MSRARSNISRGTISVGLVFRKSTLQHTLAGSRSPAGKMTLIRRQWRRWILECSTFLWGKWSEIQRHRRSHRGMQPASFPGGTGVHFCMLLGRRIPRRKPIPPGRWLGRTRKQGSRIDSGISAGKHCRRRRILRRSRARRPRSSTCFSRDTQSPRSPQRCTRCRCCK